ncbi:hypothetical protein K3G39_01845 [Pontibacter sp. HSC-14F20]|uniref:DUF5723 family protein n=1 Tax=Pontibacter sp. HSC-14F20 TaxID=2864136 RepID=UPI001C72CD76|nr:DUF5723 family protein [Pontibacter sp. HSC-14F20]MBX0331974.1 hypothetical protein [Pontibacter sp. HSC-14F20]
MNRKIYALKFGLCLSLLAQPLLPQSAEAQQLGIANSNYAGTNSLYSNPSAIADSRHKFYLNLFSAEFGATNNYLRYDAPMSLFKLARKGEEFKSEYIQENLNGKQKLVMAGADFKGPALMLQLSPLHSIAITTRVRAGVQANNLSEEVARLYKVADGEDDSYLYQPYTGNNMNLNVNAFSEFGLSYARVVLHQGTHFIKAGITIKRLNGGSAAFLNLEDTDLQAEDRPVAGTDETDYVVKLDKVHARYGYAAIPDFDAAESGDLLSLLLGSKSAGSGWGADLGFTYEHRTNNPDYQVTRNGQLLTDVEQNKYKYRVAVSLMDIGGINYNNPDLVWAYDVKRTNKEVNLTDIGDGETTEEMLDYLNGQLDVSESEKQTSFRAALPTALNISLDYRLTRTLYANATLIQGVRGRNAIGMRQNSLFAVTPRAEFKKFEVAMPVALQNNYSVLTVGAMVRFMNFYVGSDNIGGAFNLGKPYGANAYVGVSLLPLLKRNPKEKKTTPATTQQPG